MSANPPHRQPVPEGRARKGRPPLAPWVVLLLLPWAGAGATGAQWQWLDDQGRRVYSDTPPPPSVPERRVLQRPSPRAPAPAAADGAARATIPPPLPGGAPSAPRPSEPADAERRRAEQAQWSRARADNCERARRAKSTLETGVRIATVNERGERVILDETARAAEARRLDRIMATDCGPLPDPATP